MKTKKLFLAVRTSSSHELQPNWRPISASPAKRDLFISVSLECGRFTGIAADRFDDAAVIRSGDSWTTT
jgi:hypothetical protein